MSKRLILILTLVLILGVSFAAYAEVQNVKVSGDIKASAVVRRSFGLTETAKGDRNKSGFFMSQVRARIDADLTDNVSTTVRLINEREWGQEGFGAGGNDNASTSIDLDLAYVTLKEFLYSPLTLTVGRQELKFGNQLIIGKSRNFNRDVLNGVPFDLTERDAFDAIRATLNYDPLTVDLYTAKLSTTLNLESVTPDYRNNDIDLFGVNARYEVNKKTAVEGYYILLKDRNRGTLTGTAASTTTADKTEDTNVFGVLLSASPIENLKASLETAYQFGQMRYPTAGITSTTERNAWAIQAMLDYTFAKVKYTPAMGASYTRLSGGKNSEPNGHTQAWNSLAYNQKLNNIAYAILPFSNLEVYNIRGSLKPMEDVTVALNYGYYRLCEKIATLQDPFNYSGTTWTMNNQRYLGQELDLTATYDYTEDVQFALTSGWFRHGTAFSRNTNNADFKDATQVIGSMKVTF